jgi:hypothetical protein
MNAAETPVADSHPATVGGHQFGTRRSLELLEGSES